LFEFRGFVLSWLIRLVFVVSWLCATGYEHSKHSCHEHAKTRKFHCSSFVVSCFRG
jgi:hypothetical protein